jgi:hypothetical protein
VNQFGNTAHLAVFKNDLNTAFATTFLESVESAYRNFSALWAIKKLIR